MEVVAFQSLSTSSPSFFHGRSITTPALSYSSHIDSRAYKKSVCQQHQQQLRYGLLRTDTQIQKSRPGLLFASSSSSSSPTSLSSDADVVTDVWLLEPIGDGDWRHIGSKVARPGPYEIVSNTVIVGRVPDKAGLVIPVATVSGMHARFEKKQGKLYLTDLDSTNGTYVNERKLKPGEVFPIPPGSRVTFGDTHLAIFLVSKMENVQVRGEESAKQESSSDDALQTKTAT